MRELTGLRETNDCLFSNNKKETLFIYSFYDNLYFNRVFETIS